MIDNDLIRIASQANPLDIYIEMFKYRNFDFIVQGEAKNSEGYWNEGENAVHEKQRQALEILTDNEFNEFLYGGAAGGSKTFSGCAWLAFSCLSYPDTNWFVARKELKDLLGSVFKTFKTVFKLYGITDYKFNAQRNYIEFPNKSVINLIEVKYKPSDPEFEDLGSYEYTGGWIEEIGEIHEKAFQVLGTRIGRYNNHKYNLTRKLFMTCNPKRNWAKSKFYDKHITGQLYEENKIPLENGRKRPQKIFLECLVTENPFIEQEYIDGLYSKATEDKSTYERLFKANWNYEDNPYQLPEQEMIDCIFDNDHVKSGKGYLTADVAFQGADKAVIIAWKGWVAKEILTFDISDAQQQLHAIMYLRKKYTIPKSRCIADGDGAGKGIVDMAGIKSFRNNGKPVRIGTDKPNYRNLQVQCLYMLADKINDGEIYIEAELSSDQKKDIKEELSQIQSTPNKRDSDKLDCKIKAEIKQDIGRSPDYRDALMMRMWFDLKRNNRLVIKVR